MALNDLVIPSCLNPQFFEEKIDTATKGVWFDICGGAAPVSGTIINITEIIPGKYAARAGSAISFNDAAPRMEQLILTPYDYANQIRPDVAEQDKGKAIERDMLQAARKSNVFGDNLLAASIDAGDYSIDGAAIIGAHGTQTNLVDLRGTGGIAALTITRAEADVSIVTGIDALRNLKDDSTASIDYLNIYAKKYVIVTSSAKRFSLYSQAKMDHTGASVLPGYANQFEIDIKPIAGLDAKTDYIFRLDGEPAFVSGIFGEQIWAGHDPYNDVYKWYHRFSQGVIPFRWQSVVAVTYA